jgi:XTP/dITP diphosphohydrolase
MTKSSRALPGQVWSGRRAGRLGHGYDPIFVPEGHDVTYAEMSAEEKNAISHRARAWQEA